MQELIFIIIISIFIGGMLWSDRDSRQRIGNGFEFTGFDKYRCFFRGKFTIGKTYYPIKKTITNYSGLLPSDAMFRDDYGCKAWQEFRYFKRVK